MPSIINTIFALSALVAMVTSAAVPEDSKANPILNARADLQTCPGINGKDVRAGRFRVYCNRDTQFDGDHPVKLVQATDFDDCMGRCEGPANRDWCRRAAFPGQINEPGPCYLKGTGTGVREGIRRDGWKLAVRY